VFTITPTRVARVTAVIVADAPGASRPRSHDLVLVEQEPCEEVAERIVERYENSFTFTTFTSAAVLVELFFTVTVHVIFCPISTVVGLAVFVTARSTGGAGGSGGGVGGGVGDGDGSGGDGVGGAGSGGDGSGVLRVFVNVQTTTSPLETVPSTFVPETETSSFPFRVHPTFES
jgi:hypothetical protein